MYRVVFSLAPESPTANLTEAPDLEELLGRFELTGEPEPVFMSSPIAFAQAVPPQAEGASTFFPSYFHAFLEDRSQAVELAAVLQNHPRIAEVGVQGRPVEDPALPEDGALDLPGCPASGQAPAQTPTPDFRNCQAYRGSAADAPFGVEAAAAHGLAGGRGKGVQVFDIERGCNIDHEALAGKVTRSSSWNLDHGTAVMGVILGKQTIPASGVEGLAPDAQGQVMNYCTPSSCKKKYNIANTIRELVTNDIAKECDIILLPQEYPDPAAEDKKMPMEDMPDVAKAIKRATDSGIYVIQAAGNAGEPLRTDQHRSQDFGSITVGSGDPESGERSSSNYSHPNAAGFQRVHVQAWGKGVTTTGGVTGNYDDLQTGHQHRCYTRSFCGTSSAAAIVAGVVACLSGVLKAHELTLSPVEMRQLLQDTGSLANAGNAYGIGPLPNLKAAISKLEARFAEHLPEGRFRSA